MLPPILTIDTLSTDINVEWTEPDFSGEAIDHYEVKIFDKTLVPPSYAEYASLCNGTNTTVIISR